MIRVCDIASSSPHRLLNVAQHARVIVSGSGPRRMMMSSTAVACPPPSTAGEGPSPHTQQPPRTGCPITGALKKLCTTAAGTHTQGRRATAWPPSRAAPWRGTVNARRLDVRVHATSRSSACGGAAQCEPARAPRLTGGGGWRHGGRGGGRVRLPAAAVAAGAS